MAVLVMAGSFVSGAAAGSTSTAAAIVTNFPVHAELGPPSDPFFVDQWGLQSIGAPNAWSVTPGDRSILVAVVDTGVWWTQPDIQANMWTNSADGTHGHDFVDGDSNPMDVDPSGQVYHGTGVAGVIAAITDNGQGIAGTAQISVIAVRALGPNGQGSSFNTSQAIRWAADRGARVINLSLGTNETFIGPTDIQLAVDYAWSKGALIVAAAGNSGVGTLDYPARLPNLVCVAAIDASGRRERLERDQRPEPAVHLRELVPEVGLDQLDVRGHMVDPRADRARRDGHARHLGNGLRAAGQCDRRSVGPDPPVVHRERLLHA